MTTVTPEDGQLETLGLLERLRTDCRDLYGTSSQLSQRVDRLLRQLADPMLQDIPFNLPFRVELWDRHSQHVRWVVSASTNVMIAVGAFEAAVACYPPYERFTLRQPAHITPLVAKRTNCLLAFVLLHGRNRFKQRFDGR
jgi:hypothetical protein